MPKALVITFPNGDRFGVPIDVIARSRAAYYADEYGGDIGRSLAEDTLPLFDADPGEVIEWAAWEMNWSDVSARRLPAPESDAPDEVRDSMDRGE